MSNVLNFFVSVKVFVEVKYGKKWFNEKIVKNIGDG